MLSYSTIMTEDRMFLKQRKKLRIIFSISLCQYFLPYRTPQFFFFCQFSQMGKLNKENLNYHLGVILRISAIRFSQEFRTLGPPDGCLSIKLYFLFLSLIQNDIPREHSIKIMKKKINPLLHTGVNLKIYLTLFLLYFKALNFLGAGEK